MQLGVFHQNLQARIAELKEAGSIDFTAIPGYSDMDASDLVHYEGLYVLACHPELLQQLPEDIADLHALIYFIFQYNLTNFYAKEKHFQIVASMPAEWTKEDSLSMGLNDGWYAPLLETLEPIATSTSLYFTVLMLSLAIIYRPETGEENYRLLVLLLTSVLDGVYDQQKLHEINAQPSRLQVSWLPRYLPSQPISTNHLDINTRQTIKTALLGSGQQRGMFLPFNEAAASSTRFVASPKRSFCLIL